LLEPTSGCANWRVRWQKAYDGSMARAFVREKGKRVERGAGTTGGQPDNCLQSGYCLKYQCPGLKGGPIDDIGGRDVDGRPKHQK